ncbi:phosphoglycolate phosphatase [gut metagenome]|uniref:Phosphoglycolate phosphatase n=1 Tax=gut metagenome TaxID=749906 RepID=J9D3D1_9ZZZZ
MNTELLIWDWNGTLLDDVALCNNCLNQLLKETGNPAHYDRNAYREIFGFPIIDYYRKAGFDFERYPYEQLAAQFNQIYPAHAGECTLCPGVEQALRFAKDAGLHQIILSASEISALRQQVEHYQLTDYFDELIGQNDFYAHGKLEAARQWLARQKPDPAKAVLIGDSLHDAEVAQELGVRCILCAAGHQSRERLAFAGVPVIDTLEELPALLQNQL